MSSSSSSSIDSRSSSSYSSSSSSYIENWSSSSSSSDDLVSRRLELALVNQNNGDLIPFTWVTESGVAGDPTTLAFTIEVSNLSNFNYDAILNRDNKALTEASADTSTVYVPNNDSAQYKHQKSFYVDIIAKDASGISEIRTHVEPDGYEFEKVADAGHVFYIPKFTWR